MLLAGPNRGEHFCKAHLLRACLQRIQHRQRIADASRFGNKGNFERAHRRWGAPDHPIFMGPAGNLVPTAVRQFGTALDIECKWNT
jgi:hypothetical protein